MLLKGERTFVVRDTGGFVVHVNMPGWIKPVAWVFNAGEVASLLAAAGETCFLVQ